MKPYKNLSGKSGVMAYEPGKDFILIKFIDPATIYTYNYSSAGKKHVEKMKLLAESGIGLSTYISQHTRELFVR